MSYPTIHELVRMDAQQVFNHVARHLMTQGARSTRGTSRECLYRGYAGRACAIGALIPEAAYRPDMEQNTIFTLIEWCRRFEAYDAIAFVLERFLPMLADLQRLHDGVVPQSWREGLTSIARRYQLSARVLDEFAPERDGFEVECEPPKFFIANGCAIELGHAESVAFERAQRERLERRQRAEREAAAVLKSVQKMPAILTARVAEGVCDVIE